MQAGGYNLNSFCNRTHTHFGIKGPVCKIGGKLLAEYGTNGE